MFKRIVVGVDEHEGGRDAIALAKTLLASDANSRWRMSWRMMDTATVARARRTRRPGGRA